MAISKTRKTSTLLNLYQRYLLSKVSKVRILGEAEERDLNNIFVELSIADRHHFAGNATLLGMMDAAMRRRTDPFQSRVIDELREPSQREDIKRRVKPDELLQASTRAIITGAPGCGKTTLLKYLALKAQKEGRLVIWMELKAIDKLFLARIEKTAIQRSHLLLQELWVGHIKTQLSLSEEELNLFREFWLEKFKAHELVVLLDGFDELRTKDIEIGLNNCIGEFTSALHNNALVISTRPYALGKLGNERLQEFEIEPLSQRQIEGFLGCYYPNDPAGYGVLKRLRERSELTELLSVPLLLGIVALM